MSSFETQWWRQSSTSTSYPKTQESLSLTSWITSSQTVNLLLLQGMYPILRIMKYILITRYISSRTSEASSLFFSSGTEFKEYKEGGIYRMIKADKRENVIMIASEPLTFERSEWLEVKSNTMIVITPKVSLLFQIIGYQTDCPDERFTSSYYRWVLGRTPRSWGKYSITRFRHFDGIRYVLPFAFMLQWAKMLIPQVMVLHPMKPVAKSLLIRPSRPHSPVNRIWLS